MSKHPLSSGPTQVALWLVVVLLAVNAAIMLLQSSDRALAQPGQPAPVAARGDNSGVFVVPCQLDKELWGAYLVDTRSGTIVVYQYNPNSHKLKLVAARSFVYDRYLEDYNTDPPTADIRDLITRMRRPPEAPGDRPPTPP